MTPPQMIQFLEEGIGVMCVLEALIFLGPDFFCCKLKMSRKEKLMEEMELSLYCEKDLNNRFVN